MSPFPLSHKKTSQHGIMDPPYILFSPSLGGDHCNGYKMLYKGGGPRVGDCHVYLAQVHFELGSQSKGMFTPKALRPRL